jgi:hypothetical protein
MDYDGNSLFSTSLPTPSSSPFAFSCFFYFQSFFFFNKAVLFSSFFFFAVLTTPNYSILVSPPILLASIDAIG